MMTRKTFYKRLAYITEAHYFKWYMHNSGDVEAVVGGRVYSPLTLLCLTETTVNCWAFQWRKAANRLGLSKADAKAIHAAFSGRLGNKQTRKALLDACRLVDTRAEGRP